MSHNELPEEREQEQLPLDMIDQFYSANNIRYLEGIAQDIRDGNAHFAEHDLIEVE